MTACVQEIGNLGHGNKVANVWLSRRCCAPIDVQISLLQNDLESVRSKDFLQVSLNKLKLFLNTSHAERIGKDRCESFQFISSFSELLWVERNGAEGNCFLHNISARLQFDCCTVTLDTATVQDTFEWHRQTLCSRPLYFLFVLLVVKHFPSVCLFLFGCHAQKPFLPSLCLFIFF